MRVPFSGTKKKHVFQIINSRFLPNGYIYKYRWRAKKFTDSHRRRGLLRKIEAEKKQIKHSEDETRLPSFFTWRASSPCAIVAVSTAPLDNALCALETSSPRARFCSRRPATSLSLALRSAVRAADSRSRAPTRLCVSGSVGSGWVGSGWVKIENWWLLGWIRVTGRVVIEYWWLLWCVRVTGCVELR